MGSRSMQKTIEESTQAKQNLKKILQIVDRDLGGNKNLNHILKFMVTSSWCKTIKSLNHILSILDESRQGKKCLEKILRITRSPETEEERKLQQIQQLIRAEILKWVKAAKASSQKYEKSKEDSLVALKPFIKPWPIISLEENEPFRRSRSFRAYDRLSHRKPGSENGDQRIHEDCTVEGLRQTRPASPISEEFLTIYVDEDTSWLTGPIPAFYKEDVKPILDKHEEHSVQREK